MLSYRAAAFAVAVASASVVAGALVVPGPAAVVPLGDLAELHVCADGIIRMVRRPTKERVNKTSLVAKVEWLPIEYTTTMSGDIVTTETAKLIVQYSLSEGVATFKDKATKKIILQESTHAFHPVKDMGRQTYQVEQSWKEASPEEGLYGGGGYQNGIINFKNAPVEMIQFNTEAVVPFFVSTQGYGLLWDNNAWTYLNPPVSALVPPADGAVGALVVPFEGEHRPDLIEGSVDFIAVADGDHQFFVGKAFPAEGQKPTFGSGGSIVRVSLKERGGSDEVLVQSWDNLANMPNSLTGRAPGLKKGVWYTVSYSWNMPGAGLYMHGPDYGRTTLRSVLGDVIDYYFVYGGSADGSIAGYREITGAAPLYGRWAYGLWQCKEHYDTQAHLLEAAHEYRNRSIPVDSIVQDWLYWGSLGWGPHWDPKIYPDPAAMTKELHSLNMHLMVSVWSKFDPNTSFYKQMDSSGWLLGKSNYYDAWNTDARDLFYNFSKTAHFSNGVDALWLDATEPEGFPNVDAGTHLGSGNANMNSYSLMTTQAIFDGLRRDYPHAQGARVFSLTRSSFAGQQRTGAAVWSGDISGTWDSLRRQIASSINYQVSGIPYWSEDIGGFFRPKDQYASSDYHDLLTRWFQFGAFTPIFRVHGAGTNTEIWNFGEEAMTNINASAITLRYRLLPYIYSGFARVELGSYTMQRGLIMDFPTDVAVRDMADEFMWGDAFLVTPFHTPATASTKESTRDAYFPQAGWVNFHTGATQVAGHAKVTFKLSEAPVFVRAGSIVPMGPPLQFAGERPADPMEIRIYRGSDAHFYLFEDDGASKEYALGNKTTILFSWSESSGKLTIGAREGQFNGSPEHRTFNIVCVEPGHGVGVDETAVPNAAVPYDGGHMMVKCSGQVTGLYEKEANTGCGDAPGNDFFVSPGVRDTSVMREDTLKICGQICDEHSGCGGFEFYDDETAGPRCYYRINTRLSVKHDQPLFDCYTKKRDAIVIV